MENIVINLHLLSAIVLKKYKKRILVQKITSILKLFCVSWEKFQYILLKKKIDDRSLCFM